MKALPNLLTLSRILLLIPVILLLGWAGDDPRIMRYAFTIFLLGSLTDLVDGWVARRFDCVTHLGAFLDPLADKIMTNVLLVFLASRYPDHLPLWMVLLILAREFAVQGFRSMAPCVGVVIRTDLLSKLKTFFQLFCVGALMVGKGWPALMWLAQPLSLINLWLALGSGYLSMVLIFYRIRDLWARPTVPMQTR